jgi:hypothetical protein
MDRVCAPLQMDSTLLSLVRKRIACAAKIQLTSQEDYFLDNQSTPKDNTRDVGNEVPSHTHCYPKCPSHWMACSPVPASGRLTLSCSD